MNIEDQTPHQSEPEEDSGLAGHSSAERKDPDIDRSDLSAGDSDQSEGRWELLKVLILWGVVLVISLPFFWIAKDRGPEMVETIKSRDPQFDLARADAFHARGKLHYMEGKYDRAGFYLQQALNENPNLADVHYYLGLIHEKKQEWEEATQEFEKALSEDSKHYGARFELSQIQADQGRPLLAVANLLSLEDLLPEDSPVREEYPVEQRLMPLAQELLKQEPDHPHALILMARDAMRRQDLVEAETLYRKVLTRYPDNLAALMGLVDISEQQENATQLIERLTQLVQRYPRWVALYDRLQSERENVGEMTVGISAGLFRQLDRLPPEHDLRGFHRSGMQLIGYDLIERPTILLNLFEVQLHWRQDQGLIWESEKARPIYRLQNNLFARNNRLFEVLGENLVPNGSFEFGRPGPAVPAEWNVGYFGEPDVSTGWLQIIEEDLPSLKVNRFIRLDTTGMDGSRAVGVYSRRFPIKAGATYLFGCRVRSRGGIPQVIFRWQEAKEKNVQAQRVGFSPHTTDWELQHAQLRAPVQATLLNLVVCNLAANSVVGYDDLFIVELEGVDKAN